MKRVYTFLWYIENYSYCKHNFGDMLSSPLFIARGLDVTVWTLRLYPRGDSHSQCNAVMELFRHDVNEPKFCPVTYELAIVAKDGSTPFSKQTTSVFSAKDANGWSFGKMSDFFLPNQNQYLPHGILTLRCRLTIGVGDEYILAPICARTRIKIAWLSVMHVVDGFSSLQQKQEKTQTLCLPPDRVITSSVSLSSEKEMIFALKSLKVSEILLKCNLYFLGRSGKKLKCGSADYRFHDVRSRIYSLKATLEEEAIKGNKCEYLPDDKLSLYCVCTFSLGIEFNEIEGIQNSLSRPAVDQIDRNMHVTLPNVFSEKLYACPSLGKDLEDIYREKFRTDVVLRTKTNSFPAHGVVLCARSPVFNDMIRNSPKEKDIGSIHLQVDLDDKILKLLLLFLYSEKLGILYWETAAELYCAAEKYQIEKLKLVCSLILIQKLSIHTATKILTFADNRKDPDLELAALKFIRENKDEISQYLEYEQSLKTDIPLAVRTELLNSQLTTKLQITVNSEDDTDFENLQTSSGMNCCSDK